MARFKGTFNEFYQWADARTRNWIKEETQGKRRKQQLSEGCPRCKRKDGALTSAHATPRKDVVRAAVGATSDTQEIELDLNEAWTRIKEAHKPFAEKFRYLCAQCHIEVDGPSGKGEKG